MIRQNCGSFQVTQVSIYIGFIVYVISNSKSRPNIYALLIITSHILSYNQVVIKNDPQHNHLSVREYLVDSDEFSHDYSCHNHNNSAYPSNYIDDTADSNNDYYSTSML